MGIDGKDAGKVVRESHVVKVRWSESQISRGELADKSFIIILLTFYKDFPSTSFLPILSPPLFRSFFLILPLLHSIFPSSHASASPLSSFPTTYLSFPSRAPLSLLSLLFSSSGPSGRFSVTFLPSPLPMFARFPASAAWLRTPAGTLHAALCPSCL